MLTTRRDPKCPQDEISSETMAGDRSTKSKRLFVGNVTKAHQSARSSKTNIHRELERSLCDYQPIPEIPKLPNWGLEDIAFHQSETRYQAGALNLRRNVFVSLSVFERLVFVGVWKVAKNDTLIQAVRLDYQKNHVLLPTDSSFTILQ